MRRRDLRDVLRAIFSALGMPRSFKEVGVGRDKLGELGHPQFGRPFVHTNPDTLEDKEHVLELLEMGVE